MARITGSGGDNNTPEEIRILTPESRELIRYQPLMDTNYTPAIPMHVTSNKTGEDAVHEILATAKERGAEAIILEALPSQNDGEMRYTARLFVRKRGTRTSNNS